MVFLTTGNKYWINERERRAAIEYPHLDEIKVYLQALSQQEKDFHSSAASQKYLRKNKIVTAMLRPGTDSQYSVLKQDTLSVDHVLTQWLSKYLTDPQQGPFTRGANDLLLRFNELSQIYLNKEEFFALVFFCQFDVEKYVFE